MLLTDFFYIIEWWFLFLLIGFFFFPVTANIFNPLDNKGYSFGKVIGVLVISYVIFLLGLGLVPFTTFSARCITVFVLLICFFYFTKQKKHTSFLPNLAIYKQFWKTILFEEVLFFIALFSWSYIRSFQPDIYGLEKYMDFGFLNSILRASYFPPKDMWFTPLSINYYYFGHLFTAVLTKISGIPSPITYNIMIATIFAFCFTLSYSLVKNLIHIAQKESTTKTYRKDTFFTFFLSVITASCISLGGNLHTLYMFFLPYNTDHPVPFSALQLAIQTAPNGYWYPNATRFIYNTIHEFPLYSFVVSDLHGHVLSIPIVLTIITTLAVIYIQKKITLMYSVFISFLLATAYMTNAWDGAIYLLLTIFVIITVEIQQNWPQKTPKKNFLHTTIQLLKTPSISIDIVYFCMIVIAGFFLLSLPFSIHFKPFVGGVGILCAPSFLAHIQRLGPFLFEADHCQKSPLWQLFVLHGFYYFFICCFVYFLSKTKKLLHIDIFVLLIITIGSLLIIIPEFIYLKDIYPAHYRANTMFKLVYQSFIMLSLISGYIYFRITNGLKNSPHIFTKITLGIFFIISFFLTSTILYYPKIAVTSYYEDLKKSQGLDGTIYLQTLHPDDYAAIQWINRTITGQPIIAEAQGDSYTDYERISTNTGLPTILGWTVHEWLWRGTYDIPAPRIAQVQTLYETTSTDQALTIIHQYNVSYIYVGDLERQKYTKLTEDVFNKIGHIVYQHGNTRIYKITS